MIFSIAGDIIKNITMSLARRSAQKEGEKDAEPYVSADCFTVHAPKWAAPVMLLCAAFFSAFAIFSYKVGVPIGSLFFLAFVAFCILGLVHELVFRIKVDGVQISVEGTMVNAVRFYDFAWFKMRENIDRHRKLVYKIRRVFKELLLTSVFTAISAVLFVGFILGYGEYPFAEWLAGCAVFGGIFCLSFFFLLSILSNRLTVDEPNHTITYSKGLRCRTADISQILYVQTKKRFGENNAVNWILNIQESDGKSVKKKITSLDRNADRLIALLVNEYGKEEEEES